MVRDQLRLSDGWVRCGRCGEVFDAQSDLREQLPDGHWVVLAAPASGGAWPVAEPGAAAGVGDAESASAMRDPESEPVDDDVPGAASPSLSAGTSPTAQPWPSADWLDLSAGGATSAPPAAERVEPRMPAPDLLDLAQPEDRAASTQDAQAPLASTAPSVLPGRPAADAAQVGRVLRRGRAWVNAEPTALAAFLRPGRATVPTRQAPLEPSLEADPPPAPAIPAPDAGLERSSPDAGVDEAQGQGQVQGPRPLVEESPTAESTPPSSALPMADEPAARDDLAAPPFTPLRPSFLDTPDAPEEGEAPRRRRFWLWSLVAAGLLIMLGVQVMRHERDQWALSRPALLPLLTAVCQATACTIEAPRRIDDIRVDGSTLMRDGAEGRYRLVFTLRNAAPVAVAMPAIELSLLDGSERPVLRRVVQPVEMARAAVLPGRAEEEVALALELHAAAGRPLPSVVGHSVLAFYP
ncbi:MAG: DUF3426 domain-containing protein [Pseudacidovorax sp.]|nr:DUF3426 domain-containing protein [Pseudacidovorax sp.]